MKLICSLSLMFTSVTAIAEESRPPVRDCAPRAVQFVLRHFGKDADLLNLTAEMLPKGQADCSFADIKVALENRGMHVQAIAPGQNTQLVSQLPIIIHLKNSSDIGHFAVLEKVNGHEDNVLIDRIDGTALQGSWGDALRICSKQMLVVSDQNFSVNQAVVPAFTEAFWSVLASFAGIAVTTLLCSMFFMVFALRGKI